MKQPSMKGMRKCSLVVRGKELFLLTPPFLFTPKSKTRLGTHRKDETGHGTSINVRQASSLLTQRGQCGMPGEERGRAGGSVFFRGGAGTG